MKNPIKNMSREAKGVLTLSAVAVILFSSVATIGVALSRNPSDTTIPPASSPTIPDGNDDEQVDKVIEYINKPVDEEIQVLHYFFDINYEKDDPKLKKALINLNGKVTNSTGIDYYTETSKTFDVKIAHSGTVKSITPDDRIYGTIVEVEVNENLTFFYSGLENLNVKKDEKVSPGTKIGTAGQCSLSEGKGNILHFEVKKNGVSINPENCFGKTIDDLK